MIERTQCTGDRLGQACLTAHEIYTQMLTISKQQMRTVGNRAGQRFYDDLRQNAVPFLAKTHEVTQREASARLSTLLEQAQARGMQSEQEIAAFVYLIGFLPEEYLSAREYLWARRILAAERPAAARLEDIAAVLSRGGTR